MKLINQPIQNLAISFYLIYYYYYYLFTALLLSILLIGNVVTTIHFTQILPINILKVLVSVDC